MIRAAIFDMDGTILDTLTDLTRAVNHAMAAFGRRHDFTAAETAFFFGSGARVALRRALWHEAGAGLSDLLLVGTDREPPEAKALDGEAGRLQAVMSPWYAAHCGENTRPYPGIPEAVRALRAKGIRTAVVSNKPDAAVQTLSEGLFPGLFDLSVGETPKMRRKPAPDMPAYALSALGVPPGEAVYVGDSEIDADTAKAAGMPCLLVTWGFRSEAYLRSLGAGRFARGADEMLRMLTGA